MTHMRLGAAEDSPFRKLEPWKDDITLTPWSGIQMLDFGLAEDLGGLKVKFLEHESPTRGRPQERMLTKLSGDADQDHETRKRLGTRRGVEYSIDARKAAEAFDGVWLPAPVFRIRKTEGFSEKTVFDRGPSAWARMRIAKLTEPDTVNGHGYRVQLAFDTALDTEADSTDYVKPSVRDAENGRSFRFADDPTQIAWFLNDDEGQSWAADWIEDAYKAHILATRGERGLQRDDERQFEDWACFLTLATLLARQCKMPRLRLSNTMSASGGVPPVDVDLVLDVGNSRICGLLVERHADEASVDLTRAFPLEVRDLNRPERHHTGLLESRVEFAEASFGDERHASRSGNRSGFVWPGLVRIGPEARRLMEGDEGTESISGLSSPKRYLWDVTGLPQDWRFHGHKPGQTLPRNVRAALQYLNEAGDVIAQVKYEEDARLRERGTAETTRAIRPQFSRSACFGLMLAELFAHALVQVNDPASRAGRRQSDLPRRLARIVLTLPTATTVQEQAIIRSRAEGALKLIWALSEIPEDCATGERPDLQVEWDEASCTQLVWLYNEIVSNFGGAIDGYLDVVGHPRPMPGKTKATPSMRIACLDVGGGTTDLMVTTYHSEANRVLKPVQNFREGFRVAGDDILKSIVSRIVLPAIESSIGSEPRVRELVRGLFGGDLGAQDQRAVQRRRQMNLRVLYPLAVSVLEQLESGTDREIHISAEMILSQDDKVPAAVLDYLQAPVAQLGLDWTFAQLDETVSAALAERVIQELMQGVFANMTEVIGALGCDVVLMTGRPTKLRAVSSMMEEALVVPPHRLIRMDQYKPDRWYAFRSAMTHTIGDPKSTVAVGAMLMSLAAARLPNFRVNTEAYRMRSTARFIGEMERNGQIQEDRILFREDAPDQECQIRMYTPVHLGARQIDQERWTVTPLYMLEFTDPDKMAGRLPITVTVSRADGITDDEATTAAETLRAEALREAFIVTEVEDAADGGSIRDVTLSLNTMGFSRDYWLDSGVCDV